MSPSAISASIDSSALRSIHASSASGTSVSAKIASTGHSGIHAPQSIHSSGSMTKISVCFSECFYRANCNAFLVFVVYAGGGNDVCHGNSSITQAVVLHEGFENNLDYLSFKPLLAIIVPLFHRPPFGNPSAGNGGGVRLFWLHGRFNRWCARAGKSIIELT